MPLAIDANFNVFLRITDLGFVIPYHSSSVPLRATGYDMCERHIVWPQSLLPEDITISIYKMQCVPLIPSRFTAF